MSTGSREQCAEFDMKESELLHSGTMELPFPERDREVLEEREGNRLTFAVQQPAKDFYDQPEIREAMAQHAGRGEGPRVAGGSVEMRDMDTFGVYNTESEQVNELIADLQSFKNSKLFKNVEKKVEESQQEAPEEESGSESQRGQEAEAPGKMIPEEEESQSSSSADEDKEEGREESGESQEETEKSQEETEEETDREGEPGPREAQEESQDKDTDKEKEKEAVDRPEATEESSNPGKNESEEESLSHIEHLKMKVMEEKRRMIPDERGAQRESKIEFIQPTLVESELLLNQNSFGDIKDLVNTLGHNTELTQKELEGESFQRMSGQNHENNSCKFDSGNELNHWEPIAKEDLDFSRKRKPSRQANVSNLQGETDTDQVKAAPEDSPGKGAFEPKGPVEGEDAERGGMWSEGAEGLVDSDMRTGEHNGLKVSPREFDSVCTKKRVEESPERARGEVGRKRFMKGKLVFMSQKDTKWKETLTAKIEETSAIEETSQVETSEQSTSSEVPEKAEDKVKETAGETVAKEDERDEEGPEEGDKPQAPYNTKSQRTEEQEQSVDFIESQILKNRLPGVEPKDYQKTIEDIIREGERIRNKFEEDDREDKQAGSEQEQSGTRSEKRDSARDESEEKSQDTDQVSGETERDATDPEPDRETETTPRKESKMDESVIRRMKEINDINNESQKFMDIQYPFQKEDRPRHRTPEPLARGDPKSPQPGKADKADKADWELKESDYELSKSNLMGREEDSKGVCKEDKLHILKSLNKYAITQEKCANPQPKNCRVTKIFSNRANQARKKRANPP